MGDLFPHKIAYAKKYESLTVQQQFQPILFYEDYVLEINPNLEEDNKKMLEALKEHRDIFGIKTVITDDRIPKTGLYTIDKRQIELWGEEYTAETIIDELFYSCFTTVGAIPISEETHVE